jgi:hypothetical protein
VIEVVLTKHHGDEVQVPPVGYDNLAWVSVWGKSYCGARRSLNSQVNRVRGNFEIWQDGDTHGDGANGTHREALISAP